MQPHFFHFTGGYIHYIQTFRAKNVNELIFHHLWGRDSVLKNLFHSEHDNMSCSTLQSWRTYFWTFDQISSISYSAGYNLQHVISNCGYCVWYLIRMSISKNIEGRKKRGAVIPHTTTSTVVYVTQWMILECCQIYQWYVTEFILIFAAIAETE